MNVRVICKLLNTLEHFFNIIKLRSIANVCYWISVDLPDIFWSPDCWLCDMAERKKLAKGWKKVVVEYNPYGTKKYRVFAQKSANLDVVLKLHHLRIKQKEEVSVK